MSKEFHGIVKAWGATFRKSQAVTKKKRTGSIFAIMSVAHVDDDDDVGEVYHVEEVFPNGDMYTGQWSDGCPNGHGKYLWGDGCMYFGEWIKGKSNGKGKFCWPCGATYEGQFKEGYMDGEGTFTSSSSNTYKGCWAMNMKHGRGTKNYANGDHYEGEWRRGWPDGQGKYQWSNGNQYIGQWRNGKMKGNGTLIWSNGNRYDGCWEDGLPKGNGRYQWADGSFYVGIWSPDPKEMTGTYYPLNSNACEFDWNPLEVYMIDLCDSIISVSDNIPIFPSEKVFNWTCSKDDDDEEEEENKLLQKKTTIIKNPSPKPKYSGRFSSSDCSETNDLSFKSQQSYCYDQDSFNGGGIKHHQIRIQPTKRQGQKIMKGHKNYDLMLNLQLGIRHSIGRPATSQSLDLRATAFDTKEKIWTKFPPEGSKHTPPHQSSDFKWKDYCPLVFRTLRKLFKVDPADYMLSICGNDALRELSSPGKSGSFFYLTNDDKYMIKTMKKSEVKVLLRMLPAYYNHVRAFDNTLITKFYGLHCVKVTGASQKKVRFVIMGNLFCIDHAIHRRFDLKGSSLGRLTDKNESEIDSTTTLKDLDLNFIFRLQKVWFDEFCRQVDKDCDFLEQERIMDYSLLLGIHFKEVSETGEPIAVEDRSSSFSDVRTSNGEEYNSNHSEVGGATPRLSGADMDILFDHSEWTSIRLGVNIPARAEVTVRRNELQLIGEPTGEFYDVILVFGIIDILQDYDISKKLEHAYKSIQYDPTSISAVDPRQYSKRFRDFLFKAFTEDS